jgi:hypothetical protein
MGRSAFSKKGKIMKIWKNIIRAWFTLASLGSFLIGWVVLAHAPKPNQFDPSSVPSMPRLDPVPSIDQVMFSSDSQNFFGSNQSNIVMQTGGS